MTGCRSSSCTARSCRARVYQSSTEFDKAAFDKDSGNRLLLARESTPDDRGAGPRFAAVVAGALDTKMGGPSFAADAARRIDGRSTARVSRYKLDDYLQLFDFPSPNLSAEKRFTTSVPLQRLFFMNSDFMQQQAERLARIVDGRAGQRRARVSKAYRLISRPRAERRRAESRPRPSSPPSR